MRARPSILEEESQPWADMVLRAGDACRSLWFAPAAVHAWALRVQRAYRHAPRHGRPLVKPEDSLPNFMKAWRLL